MPAITNEQANAPRRFGLHPAPVWGVAEIARLMSDVIRGETAQPFGWDLPVRSTPGAVFPPRRS